MEEKGKKIRRLLFALLIVIGTISIVVILYYKNNWISRLDGDITGYMYGTLSVTAQSLYETGEIPRWLPNIWGGISLFHSLSKSYSFITLILGVLYYMPGLKTVSFGIYEATIMLHTFLLILGSYIFIHAMGFKRKVALFASFVGAINGYLFACYFGANAFNNIAWIPWLLTALFLSWKAERKVGNIYTILAGIIAAQFLTFHFAQSSVMILMIWFFFYFWCLWGNRSDKSEMIQITKKCILAGLIGVGLAAIFVLPTLDQSSLNYRNVPGIGFMPSGELYPFSEYINEKFTFSSTAFRNIGQEKLGYLSISSITLLIALAGFFVKEADEKKRCILRFGQFVVFFSVLSSFAFFFPDFLYYIPFINQIRQPMALSLLMCIGIIIVVAFGLEKILDIRTPWKERFYNLPLCIGLFISVIMLGILPHRRSILSVSSIVLLLIFIAIHYVKVIPKRVVSVLSIVLIVTMSFFNAYSIRISFNKAYTAETAKDKVEVVQNSVRQIFEFTGFPSDEDPFRITKYGSPSWFDDIMMHVGAYDITGYWNPIYGKTIEKHTKMTDMQKRLILENVRYWCISEQSDASFLEWVESVVDLEKIAEVPGVYSDYEAKETNKVYVYKVKNVLGGAWFVNEIQYYNNDATDDEILQLINAVDFDVTTTALVSELDQSKTEGVTGLQGNKGEQSVQFTEYNYNTIKLTCSTDVESLLVLAESDAPGWKAYIDGQKAEIITADYDRKALVIEPGEHEIELVYSPTSYEIGRVISIGTFVVLVIYLVSEVIKRKRNQKV